MESKFFFVAHVSLPCHDSSFLVYDWDETTQIGDLPPSSPNIWWYFQMLWVLSAPWREFYTQSWSNNISTGRPGRVWYTKTPAKHQRQSESPAWWRKNAGVWGVTFFGVKRWWWPTPLFLGGRNSTNGLVNFVAFEDVEVPRGFG